MPFFYLKNMPNLHPRYHPSEAMIRNIISTLLTKEISSKCGVQPEVDGYTWNNNI